MFTTPRLPLSLSDGLTETFTFDSSEDAFVNEDIDATEVTLTAASLADGTTKLLARESGATGFVWNDENGYKLLLRMKPSRKHKLQRIPPFM